MGRADVSLPFIYIHLSLLKKRVDKKCASKRGRVSQASRPPILPLACRTHAPPRKYCLLLLEGILDQNFAELCLGEGRAEDGQNPAHDALNVVT